MLGLLKVQVLSAIFYKQLTVKATLNCWKAFTLYFTLYNNVYNGDKQTKKSIFIHPKKTLQFVFS